MSEFNFLTDNETVKVGDGATLFLPSDSYPYVVVSVSKGKNKIGLTPLDTNWIPTNSNFIASHIFTAEEIEAHKLKGVRFAHWSEKYKAYFIAGEMLVRTTFAKYYRNYMD